MCSGKRNTFLDDVRDQAGEDMDRYSAVRFATWVQSAAAAEMAVVVTSAARRARLSGLRSDLVNKAPEWSDHAT